MLRVLLTGMSGTGKSTLVTGLRERGYRAIDTDEGYCEPLPDGRQQWRLAAVRAVLDDERWPILFVAGCEQNQVILQGRFDLMVLLSAPEAVLRERLASRTSNPFGKDPRELARVMADLAEVEPLLRRAADFEIDTSADPKDVLDRVLQLAHAATPRQ